jgi:DNA-binding NarL/FixJ family response regulator
VIIVLVDNEPIVRQTLDSFLTSLGHKMVCMSGASALLDRGDVASGATDILITDLNMPSKDAIDTVHIVHPDDWKHQLEKVTEGTLDRAAILQATQRKLREDPGFTRALRLFALCSQN